MQYLSKIPRLSYQSPLHSIHSSLHRSYSAKKNVADKSTISENSSLSNSHISNKQKLYTLSPYSPGSVIFLPNGAKIFNKLVSFIRLQETKHLKFEEVVTPLMFKKQLFEVSGHWQYYNEDMFKIVREADEENVGEEPQKESQKEKEVYALKPMNCPGHCLIFKQFPKHYNELPVRLSDFSSLHRNEASGALSGLTRVRRFHQDDGHIFCGFSHLEAEIMANIELINIVYKGFGIPDFKMLLSTRPKDHQFIGEEKDWEKAETILTQVLNKTGKKWEINDGDGAFYGPKIDIILSDKYGKYHQAATIQLDFQLPKNFKLEYFNEQGSVETPIIVHRAIFGSVERFLAILMDHYQGKWPFWLNPNQTKIVPVSPEKHSWLCKYVENYIVNNGMSEYSLQEFKNGKFDKKPLELAPMNAHEFNIEVDDRAESLGKRIRDAHSRSFNYLITIGDKECQSAQEALDKGDCNKMVLTVKELNGDKKIENITLEQVLQKFVDMENRYE